MIDAFGPLQPESVFLVRVPAQVDVPLLPIDPEEALNMSGAITTAGRSDMEATR